MAMVSREPERTAQLNTVLDVLRNPRRRYVLYVFQEADDPVVPFETIVEGVRKYEPPDGVTAELPPRQSVRIDLVHVHLPKLESAGLLERDARTGNVRFHGHSLIEEWAEQASEIELE
jgi:hypothetical protein